MLEVIGPLSEAGFALHWLKERSKAPVEPKWSTAPVYSAAELQQKYRNGLNLGVRLGEPSCLYGQYLHVIDIDIRKSELRDEAFAALRCLIPAYETFAEVQSGSAGASRHLYFLSDRTFRSRKLAHSEGFFVDSEGKKHWNWEIELFGTGKQVVLPPSVHPSGGLYRWIKPLDLDLVGLGLGPFLSGDAVANLAPEQVPAADNDDDDFLAQVRAAAADFTEQEILSDLELLPQARCEDRDDWLTVGQALHHQFAGGDRGFQIWSDWSKKSAKFDAKNQREVWKSFGKGRRTALTTFRTVHKWANDERERRADTEIFGDDGFDEDIDADLAALIGETPVPATSNDDDDAPQVGWTSLLERTEDKKSYRSTLHNARLLVANDKRTKGIPQINLFTNEIVQRRVPGRHKMDKSSPKGCLQLTGPVWQVRDEVNGHLWSEVRDVAIRAVLEAPRRQGGWGVKLTDRDLRGAITMAAHNDSFHPVREYLTALKWDGKKRVERLFIDYVGSPDDVYHRAIGRLLLTAAVTRIFEPGHKYDFAIILEGLQGKRKSTFIKILARHWFAELDGDFHDPKGMVELMQGAWILELPELVGFGKADIRQIKAFISRQTDKVRLAYERRAAEFPRQCIFIGSTNDLEYLRDETGGRRFWPVHCEVKSIDTDRLEHEVDQLWAEAYAIYRAMRQEQPTGILPLFLADDEAAGIATLLQETRRVESAEDGMAGRIGAWLDMPVKDDLLDDDEPARSREVTCLMEIWVECFGRDMASYGQAQSQQLGRAMRKIPGWLQSTPRIIGKWGNQRAFVRDFLSKGD